MRFWVNILALMGLCGAMDAGTTPAAAKERVVDAVKIFDFAHDAKPWRNIDDVVMGGVSDSTMSIEDGVGVFRGVVSLDRGGGFASVRSESAAYELSAFDGVLLRLRGDGKRYAFRLRTTDALDGASYQVKIQPDAGVWQEIFLPFESFEAVFRGRLLPEHPPLDPARVRNFGLLISDRQDGPFRLELARIEAGRVPMPGCTASEVSQEGPSW